MKKFKAFVSVLSLAMLCACGEEGSGNLTVSASTVGSSAASVSDFDLSSQFNPLAGDGPSILADSGINPKSFLMRIFAVGFSKNTNCSDMQVVVLSDNPDSQDWVAAPTLATANVPDGTYPCVAFEMNPSIAITPASSSSTGNCVANESFTLDVGNGGTSTLLSSGETGVINGRMAMYLSTTGSSTSNCDSTCGTIPGNPSLLSAALVVDGAKSGRFTVDALGSVADSNGSCEMEEPTWGFD